MVPSPGSRMRAAHPTRGVCRIGPTRALRLRRRCKGPMRYTPLARNAQYLFAYNLEMTYQCHFR